MNPSRSLCFQSPLPHPASHRSACRNRGESDIYHSSGPGEGRLLQGGLGSRRFLVIYSEDTLTFPNFRAEVPKRAVPKNIARSQGSSYFYLYLNSKQVFYISTFVSMSDARKQAFSFCCAGGFILKSSGF